MSHLFILSGGHLTQTAVGEAKRTPPTRTYVVGTSSRRIDPHHIITMDHRHQPAAVVSTPKLAIRQSQSPLAASVHRYQSTPERGGGGEGGHPTAADGSEWNTSAFVEVVAADDEDDAAAEVDEASAMRHLYPSMVSAVTSPTEKLRLGGRRVDVNDGSSHAMSIAASWQQHDALLDVREEEDYLQYRQHNDANESDTHMPPPPSAAATVGGEKRGNVRVRVVPKIEVLEVNDAKYNHLSPQPMMSSSSQHQQHQSNAFSSSSPSPQDHRRVLKRVVVVRKGHTTPSKEQSSGQYHDRSLPAASSPARLVIRVDEEEDDEGCDVEGEGEAHEAQLVVAQSDANVYGRQTSNIYSPRDHEEGFFLNSHPHWSGGRRREEERQKGNNSPRLASVSVENVPPSSSVSPSPAATMREPSSPPALAAVPPPSSRVKVRGGGVKPLTSSSSLNREHHDYTLHDDDCYAVVSAATTTATNTAAPKLSSHHHNSAVTHRDRTSHSYASSSSPPRRGKGALLSAGTTSHGGGLVGPFSPINARLGIVVSHDNSVSPPPNAPVMQTRTVLVRNDGNTIGTTNTSDDTHHDLHGGDGGGVIVLQEEERGLATEELNELVDQLQMALTSERAQTEALRERLASLESEREGPNSKGRAVAGVRDADALDSPVKRGTGPSSPQSMPRRAAAGGVGGGGSGPASLAYSPRAQMEEDDARIRRRTRRDADEKEEGDDESARKDALISQQAETIHQLMRERDALALTANAAKERLREAEESSTRNFQNGSQWRSRYEDTVAELANLKVVIAEQRSVLDRLGIPSSSPSPSPSSSSAFDQLLRSVKVQRTIQQMLNEAQAI